MSFFTHNLSFSFLRAGLRPSLARPYLKKKLSTVVLAYDSEYGNRGGCGGGGGLVDESMIVLRQRIHETKIAERNYEPPSDWMNWEKKIYTSYPLDVYEVMGLLQAFFMHMRPSFGIGVMALIILSVPTSAILIQHSLIDAFL